MNSGPGIDKIDVIRSFGTVLVDGGSDGNNIRLTSGDPASGGGGSNTGRTADIGEVFIDSTGGNAVIQIDDSRDTVARTVTFSVDRVAGGETNAVITGLTRGDTSIHLDVAETQSLTVSGGTAGNTFTIAGHATPGTKINAGEGNDTVIVQETDAFLNVNLGTGTDVATVGAAGSARDVRGNVSFSHSTIGTYDLGVDDSADPAPRAIGMVRVDSDGQIDGLTPATVRYSPGLRTLLVRGGTGGNTFAVDEVAVNHVGSSFPGADTLIQAGGGNDTVDVHQTFDRVIVDGGGGRDTFNVGAGNNVQGIRSQVFVNNQAGSYNLNVNASADTTPRNFSITNQGPMGTVSGLGPGFVDYHVLALDIVTVSAGGGGNTVTYDDANPFAQNPRASVVINSGAGSDTVNVPRALNAITIRGNNAADTVNVGTAGSVQGIKAALFVTNAGSRSALNIDDSADAVSRTVTMGLSNGTATIDGLAPARISYFTSDVSAVSVKAGPGGNTFTVEDTAQSIAKPVTTLSTGAGNDTVNVRGTTGALAINGQNGRDTVNVGRDGSVQSIHGSVNVTNPGSFTAINLDDRLDPTGRTVSFDADSTSGQASVTNLAPAVISYRTFDLATLTVNGGTGADTFNVNGTALNVSGPALTVLNPGGGADTVNVRATSGPLNVNGGTGNDAVNVGSASNTMDPIQGAVTVAGQGDIDVLTLNDQGSTTPHKYTVTATSVLRSGAAAVNYSTIEALKLNKGPTSAPSGSVPAVQNLTLPSIVRRGRGATLSGRLADADASDTLSLAVDWGDGSPLVQKQPGRDPFSLKHFYRLAGKYTVRLVWTDSAGNSSFQELHLVVVQVAQPATGLAPAQVAESLARGDDILGQMGKMFGTGFPE